MNIRIYVIGLMMILGSTFLMKGQPEILFEYTAPVPPELQHLMVIDINKIIPPGGFEVPLSEEIELAMMNNDIEKLSSFLKSEVVADGIGMNLRMKEQAAMAIGRLTDHIPEAKKQLNLFINAPIYVTGGELNLSLMNARALAKKSLADLEALSVVEESEDASRTVVETEGDRYSLPWFVVATILVILGLLYMFSNARKASSRG